MYVAEYDKAQEDFFQLLYIPLDVSLYTPSDLFVRLVWETSVTLHPSWTKIARKRHHRLWMAWILGLA